MPVSKGIPLPHLRTWREWVGINQDELGKRSGVSAVSISRIENGGIARFGTVQKLADGLGINKEQLMHSEPTKEKRPAA